jgi:hypothetical protein
MKTYENIKNIVSIGKKVAAIGILASIPYVCEDGCAYTSGYARAAERQETTPVIASPETLETIIKE